MLGTIRKFSSTRLSKVLLFIIIIPFIFWGGPIFTSSKNTVVEIKNDKFTTDDFVEYIKNYIPIDETLNEKVIEELLSSFIGEKIIELDVDEFKIKLSDESLRKIIKNEKIFQKNNEFSRTEYEKFLVQNSLNAVTLEENVSKQEKKIQLQQLISGGITPPDFMINDTYNKINQERKIDLLNLNELFKKKFILDNNKIENYFLENKNLYRDIYKTVNILELSPKNLTGDDEFTNLFFEKIDRIDDFLAQGKKIEFIIDKFSLNTSSSYTFNDSGLNKKLKKIEELHEEIVNNAFKINESDPSIIIELDNKYYLIEVNNTENIQREINDAFVQNDIKNKLETINKREFISKIIIQINTNQFKKAEFDKLSTDNKIPIKKININNSNDNNNLKDEIVKQIYKYPEKQVIVVTALDMSENFLVYIDKINNKYIKRDSENYQTYMKLSKRELINSLYNTYDIYLKKKYKININNQALDGIKSYIK